MPRIRSPEKYVRSVISAKPVEEQKEPAGNADSSSQETGGDWMAKQANNNGANLGFEAQLWAAADKLRGNMEPSDYKHVVLGLIFLKYISDAFEAKRGQAAQGGVGRRGGSGGVPRRKRILGDEAGPVVTSTGQGEAAVDRQGHR